jgi:NADH-quinone oxidoreductase subunit K
LHGHIFALVVMTVAAAESAIALALLVAHYRHRHSIAVDDLQWMKG